MSRSKNENPLAEKTSKAPEKSAPVPTTRKKWPVILAAVLLLIFGAQFAKQSAPDRPPPSAVAKQAKPPGKAILAAKEALEAEPKIKDVLYQPDAAVQWQVGVIDDGTSRTGYAQYICMLLADHGAIVPGTHVRIVDIVKVKGGANFRSAALGHVACDDGRVINP
tara:strand:- start:4743 stop:5237 length:495 start_codon:yes stop_codon:yes gene_type:complete